MWGRSLLFPGVHNSFGLPPTPSTFFVQETGRPPLLSLYDGADVLQAEGARFNSPIFQQAVAVLLMLLKLHVFIFEIYSKKSLRAVGYATVLLCKALNFFSTPSLVAICFFTMHLLIGGGGSAGCSSAIFSV